MTKGGLKEEEEKSKQEERPLHLIMKLDTFRASILFGLIEQL